MAERIHIVHLVYRFSVGGLENVIVQLINGLPAEKYRHSVLAMTEIDPAFAARTTVPDVQWIELNKQPGHPYLLYPRFLKLLRQLRPDVVHSCNLAALEMMPVAAWARVPLRVHAEHGWDVADPTGDNKHYRFLRRLFGRCVHRFVTVSDDLTDYLLTRVRIPARRIRFIANGVDLHRFFPSTGVRSRPSDFPFAADHWVVGTVGRLAAIKNQGLLIDAFSQWLRAEPSETSHLRLAIIGDGPDRARLESQVQALGIADRVWFAGARADIAEMLRTLDCFVLPSTAEGMPCTLQEAMASALPIIATQVGAIPKLLQNGRLGCLVPPGDVASMVRALNDCWKNHSDWQNAGLQARQYVLEKYSLDAMLLQYDEIFGEAAR